MNIKLIALDMDGTTLDNNHITISRKNRSAITYALEKGIFVVPATGRTRDELPRAVEKMSGIRYAITSNGAAVIDLEKNEQIYSNLIESKLAVNVLDIIKDQKIFVELYYEGKAYIEKRAVNKFLTCLSPWQTVLVLSTRNTVNSLTEFLTSQNKPVEKIEIHALGNTNNDFLEELKGMPLSVTTSGYSTIEITSLNANKGGALAHLSEFLGINASEVMAVGDNFNDKEMLDWAGISVAVENADPEIKKAVDFITLKNNQGGAAYAINRFVKDDNKQNT